MNRGGVLTARAAILQALERPGSGKEVMARVAARSKGAIQIQCGSVYPTLHRLEREGLVRGWTERRGRGRPRRNYELTESGIRVADQIRQALRAFVAPTPPRAGERALRQMAAGIQGCEEASRLAGDARSARVR